MFYFQVLRYDVGGKPLWVSNEHVAKAEDIPKCSCGAEREFEFQVIKNIYTYITPGRGKDLDLGMCILRIFIVQCNIDISLKWHILTII